MAAVDDSTRTLKGKYRLLRKLGQGGMGAVYLSHHELLDQPVAVKLMTAQSLDSASAVERFLREARALAALHHPGVCRIFDVDTNDDGLPFIVMEFIDGQSLDAVLRAHPETPLHERVRWVVEASLALAAAHDRQIIHRDVKPANIMLTREQTIRIVDFGVARRREDDARMLTGDAIVGTVNYLSPEQIQGEPFDHRCDVWAMAVTLYQLLSAKFPFEGTSFSQYLMAVIEGAPQPLSQRGIDVPPGLWAAIARALRPQATRTPDLRRFADELRPFAEADPAAAPTLPVVPDTQPMATPAAVTTHRQQGLPAAGETAQVIEQVMPGSRRVVIGVVLGAVLVLGGGVLALRDRPSREPMAPPVPAPSKAVEVPVAAPEPAPVAQPDPAPVKPIEPAPVAPLEPVVAPTPSPSPKPTRVVPKSRPRPVDKNPEHL
ncbi:MAG: protein kinase [Archangiaceae bacterium]|nr:protein kinase [Archangiaceae bacterium]